MKRFVKITAFCDTGLNVVDYPFDRHNCDIRFGSYDMNDHQLILTTKKWDYFSKVEPANEDLRRQWEYIRNDFRTIDFSESRGKGESIYMLLTLRRPLRTNCG